MEKKKNRFAQIYKGEVIYIFETHRTMEELNEIFDPNTFWFDVTYKPEVRIGYVQGVDNEGKMCLVQKSDKNSIINLKKNK